MKNTKTLPNNKYKKHQYAQSVSSSYTEKSRSAGGDAVINTR